MLVQEAMGDASSVLMGRPPILRAVASPKQDPIEEVHRLGKKGGVGMSGCFVRGCRREGTRPIGTRKIPLTQEEFEEHGGQPKWVCEPHEKKLKPYEVNIFTGKRKRKGRS